MKKKILIFAAAAISCLFSVNILAASFSDVTPDNWAYKEITKANEIGFMDGMGDGTFGIGKNVTRSQFVSMLVRMFGWEKTDGLGTPSFSDVDSDKWYFSDLQTAVAKGAVKANGNTDTFRPDENITREEMAVMLVRALGYDKLASESEKMNSPFVDVTSNKGYINIAYDFGIVSGKAADKFIPDGTALREEAAAMMVRCYDKYNSKLDFKHGFYAFSSYNQKDLASRMNAVSFGWGKMEYTNENGVVLNTTAANNNEWNVPSGYKDIVSLLKTENVKTNLNVFMSASDGSTCSDILSSAENRQAAVDAIIDELTVSYKQIGYNPYSGVTIDFENMRGQGMRENFVLFLNQLKGELNLINKSLYVAVQPKLKSGAYFDGYDFKAIGDIADKVIVMAYNYQPSTIPQDVMDSGFTTTPVTPFDEIYYALRTVTDSKTGIQDKSKIVLGLSMASVGWNLVDGKITNARGLTPSYSEILGYIENGAKISYSEKYRNPCITFADADGTKVIWYENAKSVADKIKLAEMFGIKGVSVWRLGTIPDFSKADLNVWNSLNAM